MRLLIFLLALMSAFFVPKSYSEPDLSDLKSPKFDSVFTLRCGTSADSPTVTSDDKTGYACHPIFLESLNQLIQTHLSSGFYSSAGEPTFSSETNWSYTYVTCRYGDCDTFGVDPQRTSSGQRYSQLINEEMDYSCPPESSPEHTIPVPTSNPDDVPNFKCAKELEVEDCPAGYHSKNVSRALGSSTCVPKDCPEIGSGTSLSSSKMTGGVPFSGGGMYCNDGCAYSVPESNITSQNYALGVSQGAACGDKPYDNKKLSEHDDGSKCELNTNGDVDVLFCSDPATPPDGTEPPKPDDPISPVDNDDLKKDNTKTPDKPLLNCANEDVACQIENLKIQAENDAKNLREDQVDRFNNALDADTRNTNAIIGAIEAFHTTVYIADQKADTYQLLAQSQIERLITTVENGSSTGGGSGGDDTGTGGGGGGGGGSGGGGSGGDGGDGEPCEGSAADCVPLEDSELSVEQINLDQYADKYDDWLRDAELPTEKCITLTTGRSICLSFEYYIIFFQAISGLIVMAGLLHSGRIISGAL